MGGLYILKDKVPVKVEDIREWATHFEEGERVVKQDKVDDILISTVFLGIDHSYGDGPPMVFETMIFGGKHDDYQVRYQTWDDAEKGHEVAVKLVIDSIDEPD